MKILVLSSVRFEAALRELGHDVRTCSFLGGADYTPDTLPCSIHTILSSLRWEPDVIFWVMRASCPSSWV